MTTYIYIRQDGKCVHLNACGGAIGKEYEHDSPNWQPGKDWPYRINDRRDKNENKIIPRPVESEPEAGTQAGLPGIALDVDYIPKGKGVKTQISLFEWGKLKSLREEQNK